MDYYKNLVTPETTDIVDNARLFIFGMTCPQTLYSEQNTKKYFHETYSIELEDGSKLQFSGVYSQTEQDEE